MSEVFNIVKTTIKVLVVAILMALFGVFLASHQALGYLVSEIEPGIAEIRQGQVGALVIDQVSYDKKKKWIYLAVKEQTRGRMRYFYARAKDFSAVSKNSPSVTEVFKPKTKITKLQFGMKRPINNTKGRIPFGSQKAFYPLLDLRT